MLSKQWHANVIKALNVIVVRVDSASYSSYISYDAGKKTTFPSQKHEIEKGGKKEHFSDTL